jgi:hypothetical protein
MPNQELVNYIQQELAKGIYKQAIINNLLLQGWQQVQIDEAFSQQPTNNIQVPMPPPSFTQNIADVKEIKVNSTTMWDAFEHVLMFISLYVMATAIGLILNFFVDRWFPAVAIGVSSSSSYYDTAQTFIINGYLASLIVSTPIFAFLFIIIQKRTMENPDIKNLNSRKILIYLTLVATFLIMLTNVIITVFNFLNGNVSLNFLLHLTVNLGISGLIFGYYAFQVKGDREKNV